MESKKDQKADEYQYEGEKPSGAEFAETVGGQSAVSSAIGRRILIPVVIIVAVVLVYFFLGRKGDDQTTKKAAPTKAKKTVVTTTQPTDQSTVGRLLQTNQAMNADITQLKAQVKKNQEQQAQLQGSVDQIGTNMANLNASINGLQRSMEVLDSDVALIKEKVFPKPTVKKRKKIKKPEPVYYINAILPGRAWLRSSDGSTRTVRVGDRLAGYGRINMILPKRGLVMTSSGKYIRYGKDDS